MHIFTLIITRLTCQLPAFHGMDEGLFKKAIDILVKSGKAATFVGSSTDSTGIKFFG